MLSSVLKQFLIVILKLLSNSLLFLLDEFRLIVVRRGHYKKVLKAFLDGTRLVCHRQMVIATAHTALKE